MDNIESNFVPYQVALDMKSIGFDEPCFKGYFNYVNTRNNESNIIELLFPKVNISGEDYLFKNSVDFIKQPSVAINHHPICNNNCSAPLYQQAFSFFREKYKLEGVVQQAEDFKWYKWKISQYNEDGKKYVADWYEYETHEEAELECLVMLIDIVKLYK